MRTWCCVGLCQDGSHIIWLSCSKAPTQQKLLFVVKPIRRNRTAWPRRAPGALLTNRFTLTTKMCITTWMSQHLLWLHPHRCQCNIFHLLQKRKIQSDFHITQWCHVCQQLHHWLRQIPAKVQTEKSSAQEHSLITKTTCCWLPKSGSNSELTLLGTSHALSPPGSMTPTGTNKNVSWCLFLTNSDLSKLNRQPPASQHDGGLSRNSTRRMRQIWLKTMVNAESRSLQCTGLYWWFFIFQIQPG